MLHHRRVARVYEPPAGREQAEGLAAAGQVREVVVQAPEVVELVEHRAYHWRVRPSPAAAAAHGGQVRADRQQSEPGERRPGRRSVVIHGASSDRLSCGGRALAFGLYLYVATGVAGNS